MTIAPEFNLTGMVGFPINAILDFPMITPAGLSAFVAPKVNAMFKKVLKVWTEFLDSPDSRYALNDSPTGWLSKEALNKINIDDFIHDPKAPFFGFKSWNDFFIRQFKPGVRPVAGAANTIASACEAAPFAISTQVKEHDTFWIKSQPYSLDICSTANLWSSLREARSTRRSSVLRTTTAGIVRFQAPSK
jgi:phosphatidylserine decarboxylase